MQIQLIWTDPVTSDRTEPVLETPVALGSDFAQMPSEINRRQVSRMVFSDNQVFPYHALIEDTSGELIIVAQNSSIGIEINGARLPSSTLLDGDRIRIGSVEIQVRRGASVITGEGCDRMVGFLFKRRCGRTDSTGCPHCQGGRIHQEPEWNEYSYYRGYGRYDHWGRDYYEGNRDRYQRETEDVDFTDADSEAFEYETDIDFEQDMGAS